jgi:hypothetical protein
MSVFTKLNVPFFFTRSYVNGHDFTSTTNTTYVQNGRLPNVKLQVLASHSFR